jgi:dipeptidyl aminopeptidase/acylaminoacyl peptidase
MLLAHGASDENVHLSHTARLAEALDALDAAAARFHEETETETERNDDAKRRVSSREGVSSFDVAVFARERHVPRGRVARRAFEERVDAFLADAFE